MSSGLSKGAVAMAFMGPALVLFVCILVFPIGYSIYLSLFDTTIATLVNGGDSFVGLDNYVALMRDASFRNALWLLCVFVVLTTVIELVIALSVAVYLDQILVVPKFVNSLLIVPMFVIPVVSGLTFRYIFDPNEGVIGALYGVFGLAAPGVLGDPVLAFGAIVVQDVWRMWPFLFLVLYAGLKALPHEPIEAVRLDGATHWQAFRYVLLPMMKGPLLVAVILKVVESLKAFTEIYVMTGGGPGESTSILSMYIVKQAFTFFNLGMGSAASTLLFVAGALGAVCVIAAQRKSQQGRAL